MCSIFVLYILWPEFQVKCKLGKNRPGFLTLDLHSDNVKYNIHKFVLNPLFSCSGDLITEFPLKTQHGCFTNTTLSPVKICEQIKRTTKSSPSISIKIILGMSCILWCQCRSPCKLVVHLDSILVGEGNISQNLSMFDHYEEWCVKHDEMHCCSILNVSSQELRNNVCDTSTTWTNT